MNRFISRTCFSNPANCPNLNMNGVPPSSSLPVWTPAPSRVGPVQQQPASHPVRRSRGPVLPVAAEAGGEPLGVRLQVRASSERHVLNSQKHAQDIFIISFIVIIVYILHSRTLEDLAKMLICSVTQSQYKKNNSKYDNNPLLENTETMTPSQVFICWVDDITARLQIGFS